MRPGLALWLLLSVSGLACHKVVVIPDPKIPVRLQEDFQGKICVPIGNGSCIEQEGKIPEGWYCAGPEVMQIK